MKKGPISCLKRQSLRYHSHKSFEWSFILFATLTRRRRRRPRRHPRAHTIVVAAFVLAFEIQVYCKPHLVTLFSFLVQIIRHLIHLIFIPKVILEIYFFCDLLSFNPSDFWMASLIRNCISRLSISTGRPSLPFLRSLSSSLAANQSSAQSSLSSFSCCRKHPLKVCLYRPLTFAPRPSFFRHHLYPNSSQVSRHLSTMAPINQRSSANARVEQLIAENPVMVFSKSTCSFCVKVCQIS